MILSFLGVPHAHNEVQKPVRIVACPSATFAAIQSTAVTYRFPIVHITPQLESRCRASQGIEPQPYEYAPTGPAVGLSKSTYGAFPAYWERDRCLCAI